MGSGEELREAARLMRERAEACQSGFEAEVDPAWYSQPKTLAAALRREYGAGGIFEADAAHIMSWHPTVALLVADWLEADATPPFGPTKYALAVARAYLGVTP